MPGLSDVYRELSPAERSRHIPGQIFWIPAYISMSDYYVIRIGYWDRLAPISDARFRIEKRNLTELGKENDLYDHMPIPELKLRADEELVVKKVKRRPAVLVLREGLNPRRVATHATGVGQQPNPDTHVFAPVVSLRKEENLGHDYPQAFIEKVVSGILPEFIHLPVEGTVIRNESMALLTHLQSHSAAVVEATRLCLQPLYLAAALETFWQDLEAQVLH
jgi:hypothetical protein